MANGVLVVQIDKDEMEKFNSRMMLATNGAIHQICGEVWQSWQQRTGLPSGLIAVDQNADPYTRLNECGFVAPSLDEDKLRQIVREIWDKLQTS